VWLRVWLWGPVAALMATIFWLSSRSDLPAGPSMLTDKQQHAIAYALLGALWFRALAQGRWIGLTVRRGLVAFAATVAYGASDEWHQSFVPNRFADAADLLADAGGAACAVLGLLVCGIIAARRRHGEVAGAR
jgi:VanZ family protein